MPTSDWDRHKENATTLFVSPILIGIIFLGTAVAGFEAWWINQPPPAIPSTTYLDINSATTSELSSFLGIDESIAANIVAGRPYHRVDDLVERNIVPEATYDKIKDHVVAKQKS